MSLFSSLVLSPVWLFCAPAVLWRGWPFRTFCFWAIVWLNLSGVSPFGGAPTASPLVTGSLALTAWVSLSGLAWLSNPTKSLAGLVPSGTPGVLVPFLVCVELVSGGIRPLTLTVRLVANISAGHLILGLLAAGHGAVSGLFYMFVEFFVSVVQAYIFVTLVTAYLNET